MASVKKKVEKSSKPAKKPAAGKSAAAKKQSAVAAKQPGKKPGKKPSKKPSKSAKPAAKPDLSAFADQLAHQWERGWARVVARSWVDQAFRDKLLANPAEVLAAEGVTTLRDVDICITEGTGRFTMQIPLPPRPADLDGERIDDIIRDVFDDDFILEHCVMSSCCC